MQASLQQGESAPQRTARVAGGFGGAHGAFGAPAQAQPAPGPFGATHASPAFQGFGPAPGQPPAFGAPAGAAPFSFGGAAAGGAAEAPLGSASSFGLGEAAGDPQMAQRKKLRVKRAGRK
jgi:hypothetical protein